MSIKIPSLFFRTDREQNPNDRENEVREKTTSSLGFVADQLESIPSNQLTESNALGCAMFISGAHRIRQDYLPEQVNKLGETAWNILVKAFIGNETGNRITIADIADTEPLPVQTAERYVKLLTDHDLLADNSDHLELNKNGQTIMSKALLSISNNGQ